MFVNQLRLSVTAQKNAKVIEPSDDTLQFHTVYQKHGDRNLGLSDLIEKCVLKVLSIICHRYLYLFLSAKAAIRPIFSLCASMQREDRVFHPQNQLVSGRRE